jgi:hypothetical protein
MDSFKATFTHTMKKLGGAIALCFALLAGVVIGSSISYLYFDRAAREEKANDIAGEASEAREICRFHHAALYERASLYRQQFGHWPTNVQELVEAHFLPEYSQVHLCPSQVGGVWFNHII